MPQQLRVEGQSLCIGNDRLCATACSQAVQGGQSAIGIASYRLSLDGIRRIVVVGAGKAGGGMAEAVETALGPKVMADKQLVGWVNVPADVGGTAGLSSSVPPTAGRASSVPPTAGRASSATLQRIHLHAARPAGVNEPTPEGVAGSIEILRLVESLGPDDLCLCLISGGGSALMPAPVEGITLADKLAVTRHLSAAGANIEQLNTVRKQLSRIKGGGLLRACRAGRIVSLIISDVLGDPLNLIASGPTVPDASTPQAALAVLDQFGVRRSGIAPAVFEYLESATLVQQPITDSELTNVAIAGSQRLPECARVCGCPPRAVSSRLFSHDIASLTLSQHAQNIILANNATAVAAAAEEAKRLGYSVDAVSATRSEGQAEEVGRDLANRSLLIRAGGVRKCFISGGEPVVKLVESSRRGLGGRNQQLVLAALLRLLDNGAHEIAILSGGTDGEDGPTDAAGAFLDANVLAAAQREKLDPADYLARNDAYHFFEPLGALIKTGPTQTNVCDVRVVLAAG